MAWVNHITTVKLTTVIRNAPMVVRNMYRPIDPIGLNFPADGRYGRPGSPCGERNTAPEPRSPELDRFHAFTKWPRQGNVFEFAKLKIAKS